MRPATTVRCAGWIVAASLWAGCAKPPVVVEPEPPRLELADAEVEKGCYDCLLEARGAYERVAQSPARAAVLPRLLAVNLLLALREKELALDPASSLAAARALVPELAPALDAPRLIAVVEAIPPDAAGVPAKTHQAFVRAHRDFRERAAQEIAWLQMSQLGEAAQTYLELAVACAYLPAATAAIRVAGAPQVASERSERATRTERGAGAPASERVGGAGGAKPPGLPDEPPLVRFKRAICGEQLDTALLAQLRAREPRFAEASLHLARADAARAGRDGPGQGGPRFAEAFERFPTSPVVTYFFGVFHEAIENWAEAVPLFEATLDLQPGHERALLRQVESLSLLGRHNDAIRDATTLIALDTDETWDAYYWRAWNHHQLKALEQARADSDSAKLWGANARIHTLAGIIEHDQQDLESAERDLDRALRMSRGNCAAMWYRGLVHHAREQWAPGGALFEDATGCAEQVARSAQAAIAALQAREDLPLDYRARVIALREAERDASVAQQYSAAFNAAYGYTMAGDVEAARRALEVAARDSRLAEKVGQLRAVLEGR
jgi:tetratricopeptide (TPR) repeat protein